MCTLEEPILPTSTVEREAVATELLRENVPIFRTYNFAKPEVMVRMKYGNYNNLALWKPNQLEVS